MTEYWTEKAVIISAFLLLYVKVLPLLNNILNGLVLLICVLVFFIVFEVLDFFRSKHLLYSYFYVCSGMVIIFALVSTLSEVSNNPQTISSVVMNKGEEKYTRYNQWGVIQEHFYWVQVACKESKKGYLVINIQCSSYNFLGVGDQVELKYHTESFLWDHRVVVDSINSDKVLSSRWEDFCHGGSKDEFRALLSIVIGIFPLLFLICKNNINFWEFR